MQQWSPSRFPGCDTKPGHDDVLDKLVALRDSAAWMLDVDHFRGGVGPFSSLDLPYLAGAMRRKAIFFPSGDQVG